MKPRPLNENTRQVSVCQRSIMSDKGVKKQRHRPCNEVRVDILIRGGDCVDMGAECMSGREEDKERER